MRKYNNMKQPGYRKHTECWEHNYAAGFLLGRLRKPQAGGRLRRERPVSNRLYS